MRKYINGNYLVTVGGAFGQDRKYETFRFNEDFNSDFPDSIDLKITNKCSHGCSYCHESSNSSGKSFNLENTKQMLDKLPNYPIEVAIGGGNILECFDDLKELIKFCNVKSFDTRATLNIKDLENPDDHRIKELIRRLPIGVSINKYSQVETIKKHPDFDYYVTPVLHIIVGVFPIEDLKNLLNSEDKFTKKILILGYKQFGRAKNIKLKDEIVDEWKQVISEYIYKSRQNKDLYQESMSKAVAFDNLAIDQLNIRDMLLETEWRNMYLGRDFSHSMYVDAVEETFAPTSRSDTSERESWKNTDIINYFKENHNRWN